jgi:nitroreductase
VLLGRRSAQRFDSKYVMSQPDFFGIIEALRPVAAAPWTTLAATPMVDLVLFVHRVAGLDSGLYVLSRRGTDSMALLALLASYSSPRSVPGGPAQLKQLRSIPAPELMRVARALHCHQDIAATSCFAVAMLAEFVAPIAERAAAYRDLHREAGLLGQLLYLGAEARGLRGTGIGCFLDDSVHELLGLCTSRYQSLYHFTVGRGLDDPRVELAPLYPAREPS